MKKLLLVGSGQLGSRHFQSIMKEKIDLELTILENNESSLIKIAFLSNPAAKPILFLKFKLKIFLFKILYFFEK